MFELVTCKSSIKKDIKEECGEKPRHLFVESFRLTPKRFLVLSRHQETLPSD